MVSPAWLNKTPPSDEEVTAIINLSGLRPFKPMFFAGKETEEREGPVRGRRPPDAQREQWIGPYYIKMERRGESSQIRLSLYNFQKGALTLKATWSGAGKVETDRQFLKVVDFAKTALLSRTQRQRRP